MPPEPDCFQALFHRRWHHLRDVHVRSLAWLLDAPDLLDRNALQWAGKIATLEADPVELDIWLRELDAAPAALHAHLNMAAMSRLGRYAEKLLAFYFAARGTLLAYGLQVQASGQDTVGEFDFLLRDGANLIHWEFATKFYLFEATRAGGHGDDFVGPNLADTLGAKMDKILNRQLALSLHPAAQPYLPQAVVQARALIKGWLFYHRDQTVALGASGVSAIHCRGSWCTLAEFAALEGDRFAVLPRLSWLAPARLPATESLSRSAMAAWLGEHFARDAMPVMLAHLRDETSDERDSGVEPEQPMVLENSRSFVVPNDWRARAGQRLQRAVLRSDLN
ncbi:MAG: DUF1853 family protein [Herminiimonas sp.]|nr:DUF1853 family protein [Herminiimonas sp.]